MIELLVTNKSLVVQGDPLQGWTSLTCETRFNEPATGSITVPAYPEMVAELEEGRRLVVIRDGDIWCAGPIEVPQDGEWSDSEPDPGRITLSFTDDLARPAGYLTYPNPAAAHASQTTGTDTTYQLGPSNAEVIIRTLVNVNCGPGALAARQIETLALDALASVGTTTSITTRYEPLLDACRTVAAGGGGLGFRTRQDGSQIKFGVYAPADLSATARFSRDLGNLRRIRWTISAPKATSELVMGGDTGTRAYVEVTSGQATPWWRSEKFVDESGTTNTNGELTQAGTAALVEDAATASLETETVDTEDLQAGRDYTLGDKVSVVLPTGVEVEDIVRAIRLEATPTGGELVTTSVGTSDATTDRQLYRLLSEHARRLGRLETRR